MFYEDTHEELRIETTRKRIIPDLLSEEPEIEKETEERTPQKCSEGRLGGTQMSSIVSFKKGNEFPDSHVKAILPIEDNIIAVIGPSKISLLEIESQKCLSSTKHNLGLPLKTTQALIQEDLILIKNEYNSGRCIDVCKAYLEGEESTPFKHLARMDLSFLDRLHSINRLVGLRKLNNDHYDLRLMVNWMNSEDTTLANPHAFWVRFKLIGNDKSGDYSVEVINSRLDIVINDQTQIFKTYRKGEFWYHIVMGDPLSPRISFYQSKSPFDLPKKEKPFVTRFGVYRGSNTFANYHIEKNKIYLKIDINGFGGSGGEELSSFEFKKISEDGIMTKPTPINSIELSPLAQIYFDEVTEKFRIFCFTEEKTTISLHLKLLNEELEATHQIEFKDSSETNFLNHIFWFQFLSDDLVYFISNYYEKRGRQTVDRKENLMLNLGTMTAKRCVDVEGKIFFGAPYCFGGDRLLALTRGYEAMMNSTLEGVFTADLN